MSARKLAAAQTIKKALVDDSVELAGRRAVNGAYRAKIHEKRAAIVPCSAKIVSIRAKQRAVDHAWSQLEKGQGSALDPLGP